MRSDIKISDSSDRAEAERRVDWALLRVYICEGKDRRDSERERERRSAETQVATGSASSFTSFLAIIF